MVLLLDTSVLWENSCSEIRTEEDISTSVVIVIAKGILDVSSALYDILCTYFASFDETPTPYRAVSDLVPDFPKSQEVTPMDPKCCQHIIVPFIFLSQSN